MENSPKQVVSVSFRRIARVLPWAFLVCLSWTTWFLYPLHPDESAYRVVSQEIARGAILYTDVFDPKPPLIHALYGLGFRLFGESMKWMRMCSVILSMLLAFCVYRYTKGRMSRYLALSAGVSTVLLLPVVNGQFLLPDLLMTVFIWMSIVLIARSKKSINMTSVGLSGLFVGMGGITKQAAVACVPVLLLLMYKNLTGQRIRAYSAFFIGCVLPGIGILVWSLSKGNTIDMYNAVVRYILIEYKPYPIITTCTEITGILLPMSIIILLFLVSIVMNRHAYQDAHAILALFFLPVLLVRPYHHYWIPVLPAFVIGAHEAIAYRMKRAQSVFHSSLWILSLAYSLSVLWQ